MNIKDCDGYTPLHTACRHGKLDGVKLLISSSSSSVDVNIRDNDGHTPLYTACEFGYLTIVQYLLSLSSVDVNIQVPSNSLLLCNACYCGAVDVVKFLIYSSSVDVNVKDSYGHTPLHVAFFKHLYIVKLLMSISSVDMNIKDNDGYTLLHKACRYGRLDRVKLLTSSSSVDVNMKDNDGHTPLHTASEFGYLNIVQYLLSNSSVDMIIKDCDGYTPLHTACRYGELDIMKFLVSLPSVDVNIKDNDGHTPLYTACEFGYLNIVQYLLSNSSVNVNIRVPCSSVLLHNACYNGAVDVVKFLVSSSSVDMTAMDNYGYTPLHSACSCGKLDIVRLLISSSLVDVNIKDNDGHTPLYTACEFGYLNIVQYLLSMSSVDVNIRVPCSSVLLQHACFNGAVDVVKFLVSSSSVDVNTKANNGYTPLHTTCHYGKLDIVNFLLSSSSVNVNIKDDNGYTPIQTACNYYHLDIVQLLMSTEQVNPICTNKDGDTLLHIACRHGNVDIVKYLLSTGRIDPMAENSYKTSPVQIAALNYSILKLFEPFLDCRVGFPVESYSKVFLCGDTTNGKSSLVYALWQQVNGVHLSLRDKYNPFKHHDRAEPLTAGIVPHHFQSNKIGNIVLYDFAGHPEYYSSHEAVLENLMLRSPAVFIILIKLTDKLEDIEKQLYYWASFIQNVSSRVSKKSQVIVVGSHADKWRAMNGKDLVKRIDIQKLISHQEYKGFVAMDCRNKDGVGFDKFISYLKESTKVTVDRSDNISFYCHVLYAFLKTKLVKVAITLEDLSQIIENENEPSLPSNESILLEFLTILSDKGLILFIRSTDSTSSWVIIDKHSLLKEINGTLFAPSHFKEYKPNMASNTGIVPVSVLKDVFPQYNVDMLVGFLKSLEFCHEIDKDTYTIIMPYLSSSSEKLLYFPALVSVEPSSEVTITDGFGWCLWCPNPYQFFSTRFLHVLLLRLVYELSLQVNDVGIIHVSPVQTLDRSCHVWKNGISWTRDGVKTVVQVSEQNRSIVLLVQPLDESLELESLQVSSSVIQMILQIKEEFHHLCDTQECLISPHSLNMTLQNNLKDLSVFKIEDIARLLLMKKTFVTSSMTESLNISSLLGQFEPYHSLPLSVIHQLFDDSKVSQCIPEHVFREIQERCRPIMDIYPVTRESSTFQSVRDHLNRFSIFVGRNPFVSE